MPSERVLSARFQTVAAKEAPLVAGGAKRGVVLQRGPVGGYHRAHSQVRQWNWFRIGRNLAGALNKVPLSRILNIAGRVCEGPVAMRTLVQLHRTMQLPLTLATGLRTIFADVGSSPVPERLAALVRQLAVLPKSVWMSPTLFPMG